MLEPRTQRVYREPSCRGRSFEDERVEVPQDADVTVTGLASDRLRVEESVDDVVGAHGDTPVGRSSATALKSSVANLR